MRLYLSAGEDNFIEFAPDEIAAFETIPDPPITAVPLAAHNAKSTAKLTPGDLREMLARAGTEHNLDVDLLASVVKAESDGNIRAVSHAGAQGLMQLMPKTADGLGVKDSFEPDENVRGGSAYLDALLTRYRDNLALALAAYNAGPEAVDRYHGIPPYHETRAYVARVIHEFNRRVLTREAEAQRTTARVSATRPAASR
jgi:soluble lytic murein transglycosylase-like protein